MSRLLVLGNSEQAQRWSRLLEGRRTSRRKSATAAGCEALVVVNDHSAAAVHSLRQALQLRRRQPGLSVAVLNLVEQEPDAGQGDAQTLARAGNRRRGWKAAGFHRPGRRAHARGCPAAGSSVARPVAAEQVKKCIIGVR